ncbi:MAG: putative quinol monooxygenase [Acidimicrobiales bacterium]
MSTSTQVVVYEIAADKINEFLDIKDELITETEALPGLVTSATFRSNEQPTLFIDRMEWESTEAAEVGNEQFMQLPLAGRFMSMMAGPPTLAGGFTRIAGA